MLYDEGWPAGERPSASSRPVTSTSAHCDSARRASAMLATGEANWNCPVCRHGAAQLRDECHLTRVGTNVVVRPTVPALGAVMYRLTIATCTRKTSSPSSSTSLYPASDSGAPPLARAARLRPMLA